MKFLPSLSLAVIVPIVALGAGQALAGRQIVENRPALAPPVPASKRIPSRFPVKTRTNAQILPEKVRTVDVQGDSLSIGIGDAVMLPFSGVTRIITEDDEIARAFFQNGSPVLQGVAVGSTVVEIYQATGTPRVLTVNVMSQVPAPTGGPTPVAPENTPTPVPVEAAPTATPYATPTPVVTEPTPAPTIGELPPIGDLPPVEDPTTMTPSINPARSSLGVSLKAAPTSGNPSQATFTVSYFNPGASPARGVTVRFVLDDRVSYVTGSASNNGQYDPSTREVVWSVGEVPAGFKNGQLSLRVQPIERSGVAFDSQATIQDASEESPVASAKVHYNPKTTPLLTVFAMPDRILASAGGARLRDVSDGESVGAVNRLQQLGVVTGRAPGLYYPKGSTQRAEYAVMTLNGLNLRDLRELTQIKFVLSRRSMVSLFVQNSAGKRVANLVSQTAFEAGEQTVLWNGSAGSGYAPAGRYTYVCTARDPQGETTTLRGTITLVSPTPLELEGMPSFVDVKSTDWFARYLAVGEKQGLLAGFPDKTFRPRQPISRVEATAIVVRALGLSDVARQWADKDVGFLDYAKIPTWARGSVNVATTVAKTSTGRPLMRGTSGNTFDPNSDLRRDQAAIIVQRIIDRETTRHVTVSGAIVPGAVVSINSRPISSDGTGNFKFDIDVATSAPTTVAVIDTRGGTF